MFTQGTPPFTIITSIFIFSLCNAGDDTVSSKQLQSSLIMIDESDDDLDKFLDFLELSKKVCCSIHLGKNMNLCFVPRT